MKTEYSYEFYASEWKDARATVRTDHPLPLRAGDTLKLRGFGPRDLTIHKIEHDLALSDGCVVHYTIRVCCSP
jgi:hypothetical protein